jgi:hypothetical protein
VRSATTLILLGLTCSLLCGVSSAQKPPADDAEVKPTKSKIILREMTEIPLKFAEDVNSKAAKQGQSVEFVLAEDLKVGEVIVARRGARALGTVVHSKTPDFWGEPGELNVRITFLKAGKTKVPLRGATGEVGTRYIVIRGSQAILKSGTPVKAYVDADTEVEPIDSPPAQSPPLSPSG